ncbi:MAG: chromate transporter [Candidatus Sericytochromatia bacterium]|nr:chromate transporter [Candidatus Sericytochromatia bacterium]
MKNHPGLLGLGAMFLRLGATVFGGPAVHLAVFRDEFVRQRAWLDDAAFTRLLGWVQLIPGPNSSEVAMHLGWQRAGWRGMLMSGGAFILPAACLLAFLASLYGRWGQHPALQGALDGLRPVMLAVMAHALWTWLPSAARDTPARLLALVIGVAALVGVSETVLLFAGGLAMVLLRRPRGPGQALLLSGGGWVGSQDPGLLALTWPFFKAGALLYGSGYVLVGLLQEELVRRRGWLTDQQVLDAFAIGLATPGPIFGTASFLGMLLAGPWGALAATVAIFTPAFVLVGCSGWLLPRLERHPLTNFALEGVGLASLGLLGQTTFLMVQTAAKSPLGALWTVIALALLISGRASSGMLFWLGAEGGALGRVLVGGQP